MAHPQTKIFFPNLDGLRFIAFFAVFVHHSLIVNCFSTNPAGEVSKFVMAQKLNGALGVNLFFVLSGFLITYLLINEKTLFKNVQVPRFYMRRILRIWPLYFMMVLAGFIIFPLIKKMLGDIPDETHTAGWYMLFVSNFEMIRKGFADSSILNVLWSVGVEEQFYIIWPLVLSLIPTRHLVKAFAALLLCTLVFRAMHAAETEVIYYHTVAVFGDMVIGGLLAWLAFYHSGFIKGLAAMSRKMIALVYAAGILIILFNYKIFTTPGLRVAERFVYALFFAFVIAEQNYATHSIFKISGNRFLSKWGNYTYGLYCLHTIGLLATHVVSEKILKSNNPWLIMGADFTLGLGISMGMAYLSYRFFESPFLKLKNKYALFIK
jgi:peptidoglycan/LPS O-acetylase OafA/YrhL